MGSTTEEPAQPLLQLDALAGLHEAFERNRIDYWVFGGWAVDLHVGAITRRHDDIDVAIWLTGHARIACLLLADGWTRSIGEPADGSAAYERGVVRLELAFLASDGDGDVYTRLDDGRAEWAAGAFADDVAELNGVRARVIGRQALEAEKSATHDDARANARDRADLATLGGADASSG